MVCERVEGVCKAKEFSRGKYGNMLPLETNYLLLVGLPTKARSNPTCSLEHSTNNEKNNGCHPLKKTQGGAHFPSYMDELLGAVKSAKEGGLGHEKSIAYVEELTCGPSIYAIEF